MKWPTHGNGVRGPISDDTDLIGGPACAVVNRSGLGCVHLGGDALAAGIAQQAGASHYVDRYPQALLSGAVSIGPE